VFMTSQQLPERPNLEQLRNQAKSLLRSARAREPGALERFQALPGLAQRSVSELSGLSLALHDAQSVIAREYGFKSWNALREHVEERSLSFAAAVDEFVRFATGGAAERAFRLLALHPGISRANLFTELVLGDAGAVLARLQKHPDVAKMAGGVRNWEPLLYVCHTCLHHSAPERAAGLVSIARELLARGANPNATYDFQWHKELPRTALWAALCATRHYPLAEALLEAGADPTDGVSVHINAGGGVLPALELLHRFGVNLNGIPGGVPPLRYILSWVSDSVGVQWLLERGADPNLPWSEFGDAPLHVAAQRCDLTTVQLLVKHGADIHLRRADGRTALTLAELHGNAEVAAWLRAQGAKDELSRLERFVAACARGDRELAGSMLTANPELRAQLSKEHHLMMSVPAERGEAHILETMLACGFDPGVKDHDGITALHRAAMAGRAEAVRVLLAYGAPVNALDGMFAGTPLVWAAEGWSRRGDGSSGHLAAARLLLSAGSLREWAPPEKAPHREGSEEMLLDLCRAAEGSA
jgi:ankyrin repeat protein